MPRPVEITRWVPDDNSGIRLIVQEHMIPRIRDSIHLSHIALFVNAFQRQTQQQEAEALFYWVRGHMLYTPDPPDEELIKWPSVLMDEIRRLGRALGDCDDYVMLLATFTLCRGIPTRLVVIARQPLDDGAGQHQLDHIYLSLNLDGEWTPVDPTGEVAFGWEYEPVYRREEFDV
jgi:hypothetical protein